MQICSTSTEMEWKLPWLTLEQAMTRDTIQLKRYINEYESNLIHCFHVAVSFLVTGCCEPSHVVEKGRLKLHISFLYFWYICSCSIALVRQLMLESLTIAHGHYRI